MEKGTKVTFKGKSGVSHGLVERFGMQWVLVEYGDGTKAIVLEEALEVINGRKS